jgi:16S rRNA (cytidine1402-2'-O)-methyltransferase
LVLVATPIGNLGDLSPRAVSTLAQADVVCCEDTRRARALLTHAGVTGVRLLSLHGHNEHARIGEVLERLAAGQTVAVVSEAGTPAVSDPGSRVVAAAAAAGAVVSSVPGPSAVLAALVVSALPTDRFCFEGFLPRGGAPRRHRLAALAREPRTAVIYEAPGRLADTLVDLVPVCGGERPVVVVREMTKLHEEVWRGTLAGAAAEFAGRVVRGEVVIVLGGAPAEPDDPGDDAIAEAQRPLLAAGLSLRDAAGEVAARFGVPRRRAYDMALGMRRNAGP